jgi:phosphatidate cytidylyltransferase
MIRRILVAALAIPVALAAIRVGGWLLAVLVGGLGAVGAVEFYRMARLAGSWPLSGIGAGAAAVLPIVAYWAITGGAGSADVLLFGGPLFMMLTVLVAMARGPMSKPMASVAITFLGVVYPSGLLTFVVILRHGLDASTPWAATWLVLLPMILIWVGDSVAMTMGGILGGPKLWPGLSPKKTWSGSLSGTMSALVIAPVFGVFVLQRFSIRMEAWQLVVFALAVSIMGQLGDLAESLFKREAGVKDSGKFFSEHGGVLDRLDALYWGLPVAALLYGVFGL